MRLCRHPRTHRIELDISVTREKVLVAVHEGCLEPPLPHRACAAAAIVDDTHISATEVLHHPGRGAGLLRRREQMHVIRHQYVGMHQAAVCRCCIGEAIEIQPVIVTGIKAGCPVVAALDNVQRVTRQL